MFSFLAALCWLYSLCYKFGMQCCGWCITCMCNFLNSFMWDYQWFLPGSMAMGDTFCLLVKIEHFVFSLSFRLDLFLSNHLGMTSIHSPFATMLVLKSIYVCLIWWWNQRARLVLFFWSASMFLYYMEQLERVWFAWWVQIKKVFFFFLRACMFPYFYPVCEA